MRLTELFDGVSNEYADAEITGMTADSRRVEPGMLFAALPGTVHDGRKFIPSALANGAAAVLCQPYEGDKPVPFIEQKEPRLALANAAAKYYGAQPENMVAITGTNGKSSTVDFLRQIWTHSGLKAASMGTLGAVGPRGKIDVGHTTPDPITIHETLKLLSDQGVSHVAMEASSHGLEQHRMDGVELAAVAFTNFTQDHLDYHETMDAYLNAKLRLFTELASRGVPAIINADSNHRAAFEDAAKSAGLDILSVGWRGDDLKIAELMPHNTYQTLFLKWRSEEARLDLPLIGEFQALNALTAAGLALSLGLSFDAVADGLRHLNPVKGRLEFVTETASGAGIFVDYAHTPDGLNVLLRAARPHTAGKLTLVFGCGGDRDALKRPLMGEIAARLADQVIVTDDNPRSENPESIRKAILDKCPGAMEIADRGEAIKSAISQLKQGDTLLIAGKGHETGQIIGDTVIPFSDQEAALEAAA